MVLLKTQQANASRSGGSPLRHRVIGLVTAALILCAVVVPCKSQNNEVTCEKTHVNGTYNVAHRFDSNFLLVAHYDEIVRMTLDYGKKTQISMTNMTLGLDHDCAGGRFYWSKPPGQILSANYNGTDQKIYIENDTDTPSQLAMDWISRRLYWTDSAKGTIEVADLDNPDVRTVLIHEDLEPHNIAVDPLLSKLYWVNSTNEPTIEWSNLDGTNRQVLIKFNVKSDITSIECSTATGELCYIENRKKEIRCIDPFSKEIRTIRKYFSPPSNLLVTAESYFFNSLGRERFHRIAIVFLNSNGGARGWPAYMQKDIYKMTAVTGNCPLFDSPCATDNGDCPENTICLVNPCVPTGKSCVVKK